MESRLHEWFKQYEPVIEKNLRDVNSQIRDIQSQASKYLKTGLVPVTEYTDPLYISVWGSESLYVPRDQRWDSIEAFLDVSTGTGRLDELWGRKKKLEGFLKIARSKNPRDQVEIDEVKRYVSIVQLLEFDGYKQNKNGYFNCPFHSEKTPSLKTYNHNNSFYCFGCGKGGSTIDYVMSKNDMNIGDAIKYLTNFQ